MRSRIFFTIFCLIVLSAAYFRPDTVGTLVPSSSALEHVTALATLAGNTAPSKTLQLQHSEFYTATRAVQKGWCAAITEAATDQAAYFVCDKAPSPCMILVGTQGTAFVWQIAQGGIEKLYSIVTINFARQTVGTFLASTALGAAYATGEAVEKIAQRAEEKFQASPLARKARTSMCIAAAAGLYTYLAFNPMEDATVQATAQSAIMGFGLAAINNGIKQFPAIQNAACAIADSAYKNISVVAGNVKEFVLNAVGTPLGVVTVGATAAAGTGAALTMTTPVITEGASTALTAAPQAVRSNTGWIVGYRWTKKLTDYFLN